MYRPAPAEFALNVYALAPVNVEFSINKSTVVFPYESSFGFLCPTEIIAPVWSTVKFDNVEFLIWDFAEELFSKAIPPPYLADFLDRSFQPYPLPINFES